MKPQESYYHLIMASQELHFTPVHVGGRVLWVGLVRFATNHHNQKLDNTPVHVYVCKAQAT